MFDLAFSEVHVLFLLATVLSRNKWLLFVVGSLLLALRSADLAVTAVGRPRLRAWPARPPAA